jgi:hypothetical protein
MINISNPHQDIRYHASIDNVSGAVIKNVVCCPGKQKFTPNSSQILNFSPEKKSKTYPKITKFVTIVIPSRGEASVIAVVEMVNKKGVDTAVFDDADLGIYLTQFKPNLSQINPEM